jgi:hypothetical protein
VFHRLTQNCKDSKIRFLNDTVVFFLNLVKEHRDIVFISLFIVQVFISVSVILGDGLYNLIKIIYATIKEIMNARSKQGRLPVVGSGNGK